MNNVIQRVEKHIIKPSHPLYSLILGFCKASKDLYNHANYIVRQNFVESSLWVRYKDLDKQLKNDKEYPDYRNMPTAQSAQQCLKLLEKNWISFFKSIKDWSLHKDKYLGRPKMPKYKKKNGLFTLVLTNQNCRLKENIIHFPKVFNGFSIKTRITEKGNFSSFQQVRFIPGNNRIVAEVVYNLKPIPARENNDRIIGIDIGINNLLTIANNCGLPALIINGKPLKSVNQFYNKQVAHFQKILNQANNKFNSNRLFRFLAKRGDKITDYLHKASKKVLDYCVENDINTIIIGKNKLWKQDSHLGKKTNQNFVQIPFAQLIQMIQYKAENLGITTILTEESYTSGTSFIDGELPIKENYNKSRRKYRGLFFSNAGLSINADLNGAYQIIRKVFPIKWDRGCVLHPFVVNLK
jgi:putative transposase